jgi:hypothetical protein
MKTTNELPNPKDFMKLGEDAFIKNVHEKLRETLSPTEKQMWINGYLLALTNFKQFQEQDKNKYSEEELKSAFKIGFDIGYGSTVQELDLKNEHCDKWFEQFKNK